MATLTFAEARALVIERVLTLRDPRIEQAPLAAAAGRVLAQMAIPDRDYPPVARSIRDGFAVRSADVPGELEVVGEVRAGGTWHGMVGAGQCVEIMTGAPMPGGADAVVMVEHAIREGSRVKIDRGSPAGQFVNPQGAEARKGVAVLPAGRRLGFAQVGLLATYGITTAPVFARPRVAILSTGDEVVPVEATPQTAQVRNSNAWSLAVQVERAGGVPSILPVAPDERNATRRLISEGLEHDLLLLSGGVSAGKYDFVEPVLAELGAEFYFDRVLIQPGQPLVFGRARNRFFFGLPGNPASTMVTFELFARAAVELLAGQQDVSLPFYQALLTSDFSHKTGLTRFLPARLSANGLEVTPVAWQGSSDIAALARANAFLVADSERASWKAGDTISVLSQ